MPPLSSARGGLLTLLVAAVVAGPAAAQPSRTWANATSPWELNSSWVQGTPPTSSDGVLFPSVASGSTAVSPVISGTADQASFLTVLNNPAAGNVYSLLAGGAGARLTLFSTSNLQGNATANPAAALTFTGGGTSLIDPNLTVQFNGGAFVYVSGGTVLDVAGAITAASGTTGFRVDSTAASTVRLRGTGNFAAGNTVTLGNSTGTNGGRFELGVDNPFGTGTLGANGGSGGGFGLIPYDPAGGTGLVRTVGNATVNLGIGTITFGDSGAGTTAAQAAANNANTLAFTGSAFLSAPRTYTLAINNAGAGVNGNPVFSTSAVRFSGPTALRASGPSAAGTVTFNGSGRAEFDGVLSNGDTTNNGTAAGLTVGSGSGPTTVRLSNPGNTYSGQTTLNSGGLLVAADAPASGAGALGTPATGNEAVNVGVTGGTVQRLLLLDVGSAAVSFGRPINLLTASTTATTTVLGVVGVSSFTGTFVSTPVAGVTPLITVGTAASGNPSAISLSAYTSTSTAQFNAPLQRASGYTGNVNLQINANLNVNGFAGSGTVAVGGTQPAGLNAQTGVTSGTFVLAAGTNLDTGRGFYVGGGTAVVNGTLTTPTGSGPAQVGANFTLPAGSVAATGTGLLTGTGTVNLPLTVLSGGTVAPGTPAASGVIGPGVFTAAGGAVLNSGGVFQVATGNAPVTAAYNSGASATPGSGAGNNSQLAGAAGSLTFAAGINVVVDVTGATFTASQPYSFAVAAAGGGISPNGPLAPISVGSFTFLSSGNDVTANFSAAGGPSLVSDSGIVYLNFTPVPEPATVGLVAVAALGLVRRVRQT